MILRRGLTEYILDTQGIALFASDRETLLSTEPERDAFIRSAIDDGERHAPCWLWTPFDEGLEIAAGTNVICSTHPRWWHLLRQWADKGVSQ